MTHRLTWKVELAWSNLLYESTHAHTHAASVSVSVTSIKSVLADFPLFRLPQQTTNTHHFDEGQIHERTWGVGWSEVRWSEVITDNPLCLSLSFSLFLSSCLPPPFAGGTKNCKFSRQIFVEKQKRTPSNLNVLRMIFNSYVPKGEERGRERDRISCGAIHNRKSTRLFKQKLDSISWLLYCTITLPFPFLFSFLFFSSFCFGLGWFRLGWVGFLLIIFGPRFEGLLETSSWKSLPFLSCHCSSGAQAAYFVPFNARKQTNSNKPIQTPIQFSSAHFTSIRYKCTVCKCISLSLSLFLLFLTFSLSLSYLEGSCACRCEIGIHGFFPGGEFATRHDVSQVPILEPLSLLRHNISFTSWNQLHTTTVHLAVLPLPTIHTEDESHPIKHFNTETWQRERQRERKTTYMYVCVCESQTNFRVSWCSSWTQRLVRFHSIWFDLIWFHSHSLTLRSSTRRPRGHPSCCFCILPRIFKTKPKPKPKAKKREGVSEWGSVVKNSVV